MAITNPQAMNELMPRGYQPGAEWQGNKDVTDFVIETGEKFLARTHDAETAESSISSGWRTAIGFSSLVLARGISRHDGKSSGLRQPNRKRLSIS